MKEEQTIYYKDELNDDFANSNINPIKIDSNYQYIHKNCFWNIASFFVYRVCALLPAFIYSKIKSRMKIENKEILKEYKNSGYFIYINHTQPILDTLIPTIVTFPKKAYVIAHPDNLSIKILGKINKMLGALPIPGDMASSKNFIKAVETFINKRNVIAVYPEAHVWPYYTKIRNYKSVSFKYPINLNVPAIAFTVTYRKYKNRKTPQIVVYIDGPFFADDTTNKKKAQENLRNKVYECMKKRSENSNYEYIKYRKTGEEND